MQVIPILETGVSTSPVGITIEVKLRMVATDLSILSVGSGTMLLAPTVQAVSVGIVAGLVLKPVSGAKLIKPHGIEALVQHHNHKVSSGPSNRGGLSGFDGGMKWSTEDYLKAHKEVASSGRHNFEVCKIPIPTSIRYDRFQDALGENITPKEERVLELLKYGMPLDCKDNFGVKEQQKNHYSALSFPKDIEGYLGKNGKDHAVLGPFAVSPISDLRYSPLMTVPKEDSKRRVIVDFSFPAGLAINDGISKETYLDHIVKFSLPSVQSMVGRVNTLGKGCLIYKMTLKALSGNSAQTQVTTSSPA